MSSGRPQSDLVLNSESWRLILRIGNQKTFENEIIEATHDAISSPIAQLKLKTILLKMVVFENAHQ